MATPEVYTGISNVGGEGDTGWAAAAVQRAGGGVPEPTESSSTDWAAQAVEAVSEPSLPPEEKPTWHNAAWQELKDIAWGTGTLLGTGALQTTRWLPEQDPSSLLGMMQGTARSLGPEMGSALAGAPKELLKGLQQSFTTNPIENLKYRPIATISDWALPFSLAAGGLKAGAKVAGLAGKGGTAARLGGLADVVAPSALARTAGRAAVDATVPSVGKTYDAFRAALDAQRALRGRGLEARASTVGQMKELEDLWAKVPITDQGNMANIVEGTLPPQAWPGVTPEAKTFLDALRKQNADRQGRIIKQLSRASTDPAVAAAQHTRRFELARFQPLADQMSQQLGVEVSAETAETVWKMGGFPHLKEPPVYYHHEGLDTAKVDRSFQASRSTTPSRPGALHKREGGSAYNTDFMRVMAEHTKVMERWIGRTEAALDVYESQGRQLPVKLGPQGGIIPNTQKEVEAALDALKQAEGIRYVAAKTVNDQLAHDILKSQGIILPPNVDELAIPYRTSQRMLAETAPMGEGLKLWEAANTLLFRNFVLALNPKWQTGNISGNTVSAALGGRFDPRSAGMLNRAGAMPQALKTAMFGQSEILEGLTREELAKMRLGEIPVGKMMAAVQGSTSGKLAGKAVQVAYDMNSQVDKFYREAAFASHVKGQAVRKMREAGVGGFKLDPALLEQEMVGIAKDPIRAQKSIDFVNKFFGNYMDLTPMEQRIVRQIFPFWSWHKSMLKLGLSLPLENPGRVEVLEQLARAYKTTVDDPSTPDILRAGKIPMGKTKEGATVYMDWANMVPWTQSWSGGMPPTSIAVNLFTSGARAVSSFGRSPAPEGYQNIQGRLYTSGSKTERPREVDFSEKSVLAVMEALRESLRYPQVRLAETMIKGQAPRLGEPIFVTQSDVEEALDRIKRTSTQTREQALASLVGPNIKEYKVPQLKAEHLKRVIQAWQAGAKQAAIKGGVTQAPPTDTDWAAQVVAPLGR